MMLGANNDKAPYLDGEVGAEVGVGGGVGPLGRDADQQRDDRRVVACPPPRVTGDDCGAVGTAPHR